MRAIPLIALLCSFSLGPLSACGDDDYYYECANGTCWCAPGDRCEIPCAAPPCHLQCIGDNPQCSGECANAECLCGQNSSCDFACQSPPCHVRCEPGSACSGECANGTCACDRGASCAFLCLSGPCHVQCAGDNARCDGECSNGNCSCGRDSSCHFTCADHNCSASCASGSQCVLECDAGRAGTQGCMFSSCAAGTPVICPGGLVTTCGAPCP